MRFFYSKNLALPLVGDFWEKTIQSGFPAQSCFTWSGVQTICDLEEAVPSLIMMVEYIDVKMSMVMPTHGNF